MSTTPAPSLTPSQLRTQEEQKERDSRITAALDGICDSIAARQQLGVIKSEGIAAHALLWELQSVVGHLHNQGLLRRDADIACLQRWLAVTSCSLAGEVA